MYVPSSLSFSHRARCKFCKGYPKYLFFIIDKIQFKDFTLTLKIGSKFLCITPIISNDYLSFYPKNFKNISSFSFRPAHAKISSKFYKGYKLMDAGDDGITDAITCECNKTLWTFKISEREHIENRRCRYKTPIKFSMF